MVPSEISHLSDVPNTEGKNSHLLVIRLSAMGDVAMTVPVLSALTRRYPSLKITVLTKPFFKPMFAQLKNVEVFAADVKGRHKGLLGLWKLYRELRLLGIDSVVDLHNVVRSKILKLYFRTSAVPVVQIDKGRAEKKVLTASKNKIFKPLKTTHQRYADVFAGVGYPLDLSKAPFLSKEKLSEKVLSLIDFGAFSESDTSNESTPFLLSGDPRKSGDRKVSGKPSAAGNLGTTDLAPKSSVQEKSETRGKSKISDKPNSQKWLGIAPFAAFEGKMYPLSLMEEVIRRLKKTAKYKIFLFGGGAIEQQQMQFLERRFDCCVNVAGKLSFAEELSLISNLDVMLAMDSGNAHLAAMYGIPVVTLWGVTHPHAGFYPFGQPVENSLLADREKFPLIPTSVYGNKMPEGYERAMETILPEEVVAKLEMVLKKA